MGRLVWTNMLDSHHSLKNDMLGKLVTWSLEYVAVDWAFSSMNPLQSKNITPLVSNFHPDLFLIRAYILNLR